MGGSADAALLTATGLTYGAAFRSQVRCAPGRVALRAGERSWSYAELDARTDRLVHALAARGVRRGDRIAVLSENRPEYVEVQVAGAKLGAIVACQNWRLADAELTHCLTLIEPRVVLASERLAPTAARLDHGSPNVVHFGGEYEHMLAAAASGVPPDLAHPEDGMLVIYTSGTTGLPKGAVISQRAMMIRAMLNRFEPVPVSPDDNFIAWAPMFHLSSTNHICAGLLRGAAIRVIDGFNAAAIVAATRTERIAHLTVLPGVVDAMIAELKSAGIRPLSVRTVGVLADLVPPDRIAEITGLVGAPYCNSFGATETGWPPASRAVIPIGVAPRSLSKLQSSYCSIRLVDEDDNDVPDGEAGEVAIRAPSLFSGYWRAPEINAHDFRGGWFHMGDMLTRNPDGSLDFVDRRKYMIKSGAENIYPAEIERVLLASPRIADAIVVKKPDPRWGEVPVAFVVRRDQSLTDADVIALCNGKIARYKLPKEIRFVLGADLERSASGKITRRELEARLAAEPKGRENA